MSNEEPLYKSLRNPECCQGTLILNRRGVSLSGSYEGVRMKLFKAKAMAMARAVERRLPSQPQQDRAELRGSLCD